MAVNIIEYPRPVLSKYSRDYTSGSFSTKIISQTDTSDDIGIEVQCDLECPSLEKAVENGDAKVILRVSCSKSSYRKMFYLKPNDKTLISVPKDKLVEAINLQSFIVAAKDLPNYNIPEVNENYFGTHDFSYRDGDILAEEPGAKIKFNSIIEKSVDGIVDVREDKTIHEMVIHIPSAEEDQAEYVDYIVVSLPSKDYRTYFRLKKKGKATERLTQSFIVLPAITEAIGCLIDAAVNNEPTKYDDTIWANSIKAALRKKNIDLLNLEWTPARAANLILGNVVSDTLSELVQLYAFSENQGEGDY